MHEYSRCLAALLRPYDVCVNVVAPGQTVTPRFAATRALDAALDVKAGTLIRDGWPEDIAGVVSFLAGPASSYVTGRAFASTAAGSSGRRRKSFVAPRDTCYGVGSVIQVCQIAVLKSPPPSVLGPGRADGSGRWGTPPGSPCT